MLLKWFNSNKVELLLIFPFFAILLWLPSFLNTNELTLYDQTLAGPIGRLIIEKVSNLPRLSAFITLSIIIIHGILLVQLNVKYFFLKLRVQSPQLIFFSMAGVLGYLHFLSSALLAQVFIIILVFRLFDSFKKDRFALNFLDAGILMSLATLCHSPAIILFPLVFIALMLFRNFTWEEWIYPLVGFALPYLFWGSYLYFTDRNLGLIFDDFRNVFSAERLTHNFPLIQVILYAYIVFLIITASFHMIRTISNRKIQSRIFFIFFLWLFIFSIISSLVFPTSGIEVVYFGGISITFLLSNYFATCRNSRINNFLLFLLLIGSLIVAVDSLVLIFPQSSGLLFSAGNIHAY
jgi:hypothetical protein